VNTFVTVLALTAVGFIMSRFLAAELGTCPDCGAYWAELGRLFTIGERCPTCGHCSLR